MSAEAPTAVKPNGKHSARESALASRFGAAATGNSRGDPSAPASPKVAAPELSRNAAPLPPGDIAFAPGEPDAGPAKCGDCRHFVRYAKPGGAPASDGQCRANPPQVVMLTHRVTNEGAVVELTQAAATVFPTVRQTDGCGEFKPRRSV